VKGLSCRKAGFARGIRRSRALDLEREGSRCAVARAVALVECDRSLALEFQRSERAAHERQPVHQLQGFATSLATIVACVFPSLRAGSM
jgi:hypothetical protein